MAQRKTIAIVGATEKRGSSIARNLSKGNYHLLLMSEDEAIEDSELLMLTKQAQDEMLEKQPKMEKYFRFLMQNAIIALQRRIVGTLSLSAEEKYKRMMTVYPDILQRAPQQHIASFLGITPETLSRVRKQVSVGK